jgi:hypothetical protein
MTRPTKATCPADRKAHLLELERAKAAALQKSDPNAETPSAARSGVEGLAPFVRPPSAGSGGLAPRGARHAPLGATPEPVADGAQAAEPAWKELPRAMSAKLAELSQALTVQRHALLDCVAALENAAPEQQAHQQLAAHQQLHCYKEQDAQMHARAMAAMALTDKVVKLGLLSAGLTFGVTRSSGMAAAMPLAVKLLARAKTAAPTNALQRVRQAAVTAGAQWLMGAVAGGPGNLLSQRMAQGMKSLPQLAAVPTSAVVPASTRELMNRKDPRRDERAVGDRAGDRLYQAVQALQADRSHIDSDRNIALGQFCFGAATALRTVLQGSKPLGFAGTVAVGTVSSVMAGSVIALVQTLNSLQATVKVPDAQALATDLPLDEVPCHELPVFLVAPPSVPVVRKADQRGSQPPLTLQKRAQQLAASVQDFGVKSAHRSAFLALSTAPATAMGVAAAGPLPGLAKALPTVLPINTATAALALRTQVATLGIFIAVDIWFKAQRRGIPTLDAQWDARRSAPL